MVKLCGVSLDEFNYDLNSKEVAPEDLAERVRLMVEDDDQLGDALAEPEVMDAIRQLWAAIPKGRPGFQPRNLYDLLSEDAVTHRLIVDLAVRLGASITDYMEEGE